MAIVQVAIVHGAVAGVTVPDGTTLIIRDYDVEGSDPADRSRDRDGTECFESTYHGPIRDGGPFNYGDGNHA